MPDSGDDDGHRINSLAVKSGTVPRLVSYEGTTFLTKLSVENLLEAAKMAGNVDQDVVNTLQVMLDDFA